MIATILLAVTINGAACDAATVTFGSAGISIINPCTSPFAPVPPVIPPVVPPVVPSGEVSIDGNTLPNPSKRAFVFPALHNGLNGAGPEVNAYAMPPTRCNTTPALTRSWQHNIDLDNYKSQNAFDFFVMQPNESLSYKFTVGNVDAAGGFVYNDAANAVVRPTFISVTTNPCDFDTSKIGKNACYVTGLNGNSVNWANITGALPVSYCRLTKGQTYYLNIRFQDARPVSQGGSPSTDSCISGNCGGIIQVL